MGDIANTFSELNLESFAIRVFPRQQELATKITVKPTLSFTLTRLFVLTTKLGWLRGNRGAGEEPSSSLKDTYHTLSPPGPKGFGVSSLKSQS